MFLTTEDLQALAQAIRWLKDKPVISAVALKLPTFWTACPAVWFSQVEAQFATRQPPLENNFTKYNYIVAALNNTTAGEVEALILSPPAEDCYLALRTALIKAFSKKDNKFLSLSGLGLLRHIRSLNTDPVTLLHDLFLAQHPIEVRQVLAGSANTDLDEMSSTADHIMEASRTTSSFPGVSGLKKAKRLQLWDHL